MLSLPPNGRNRRAALGLALLRVTLGIVFMAHGLQKLIAWGWGGAAPFFAEAGIPLASVAAPLVILVEILGGCALVLGMASRIAAALLAVVMVVALVTVHWPHGFFMPNGYEFVMVLAVANLTIVVAGPGEPAAENWRRARSIARRAAPPDHASRSPSHCG